MILQKTENSHQISYLKPFSICLRVPVLGALIQIPIKVPILDVTEIASLSRATPQAPLQGGRSFEALLLVGSVARSALVAIRLTHATVSASYSAERDGVLDLVGGDTPGSVEAWVPSTTKGTEMLAFVDPFDRTVSYFTLDAGLVLDTVVVSPALLASHTDLATGVLLAVIGRWGWVLAAATVVGSTCLDDLPPVAAQAEVLTLAACAVVAALVAEGSRGEGQGNQDMEVVLFDCFSHFFLTSNYFLP